MWPQVPRTSGCVELLSCLFCSQHRYCIVNWTTRKRRKAGWRSHWRPLYVVLALPSSSSSLQQQALRSQLWLGLMHQYPHWHVSSYIKTHPTLLHCGFTCHCHLCLLDEELLMDRGTKDSCDVSAQRGCCDAKAQRDFTLVAWAVFTQQVCNRLKRSLLKELGPEPRPLLEAIIGRECVGWTHTEQDEWGGEEGWHNLSFQYANDQFKRWKLWQTDQPTVILALTCDERPAGTLNRLICQEAYFISAASQGHFPPDVFDRKVQKTLPWVEKPSLHSPPGASPVQGSAKLHCKSNRLCVIILHHLSKYPNKSPTLLVGDGWSGPSEAGVRLSNSVRRQLSIFPSKSRCCFNTTLPFLIGTKTNQGWNSTVGTITCPGYLLHRAHTVWSTHSGLLVIQTGLHLSPSFGTVMTF